MKTIVNNVMNAPGETLLHAIKNYPAEEAEKSLAAVLKEINASVKIEGSFKRKTRNGGFVAWPNNTAH